LWNWFTCCSDRKEFGISQSAEIFLCVTVGQITRAAAASAAAVINLMVTARRKALIASPRQSATLIGY
jgi:hypothetical protein